MRLSPAATGNPSEVVTSEGPTNTVTPPEGTDSFPDWPATRSDGDDVSSVAVVAADTTRASTATAQPPFFFADFFAARFFFGFGFSALSASGASTALFAG